ncbi:cobalamin biosynthesis protein CobW [Fusicatenibacter saccharivorans]|uniref:CobW family GTP-binding protein n=1 Tax=Fusicatenibacter saccharivorans TaxID=1150298 RepID=UPI001C01B343|nr:GTP-binding protein [Fusicatenibacter saccharivorans]MBT9686567.1 cobalamin biosynthesis protein CobW [Fusicatenibacter saccharivorans]MCB6811151.1 GTP-binding protein [bacterium MSK18_59]
MTRIDIISGFLGAGKTTLIKKLLGDALKGQQVVLIENEFGEIGIDGGFLKDAGIEIREMNSGCICCSLVGDFGAALKDVITKYHPDRIIIEPSGVGKLSDVIKAVDGVEKEAGVALNSATTVVDVMKCKMYLRNFGEFFENQVKSAGTIILSRTDKADTAKVEAAVKMLRELNPEAHIITTPVEVLGGKKVLDTMEGAIINLEQVEEEEHHHHHHDHDECCCGHDHDEEHEHHHHDHDEDEHEHHHHDHDGECCCGHDHDEEHEHHHHDHDDECCCGHDHDHEHHHHHHADEVFTSWGQETVKTFTKEQIEGILKKLSEDTAYGMVLRAKGMVAGADGQWIYFDMVPEEYEVRDGAPEFTGRICVIGSKLAEDKLAELFGL